MSDDLTVFFKLLGSSCIKAAHKTLVKLTPGAADVVVARVVPVGDVTSGRSVLKIIHGNLFIKLMVFKPYFITDLFHHNNVFHLESLAESKLTLSRM